MHCFVYIVGQQDAHTDGDGYADPTALPCPILEHVVMPSLIILSLPATAIPGESGEPETRLKNWIEANVGTEHGVASIALPDLKTGTLDNLVQQAEDVAKLDGQLQNVLLKVHESIVSLYPNDDSQISAAEQVDGRPALAYLQQFGWNIAKYRPDRAISALLATLSEEAYGANQDLKQRMAAYNATKQQVQAADRKRTGDLSTRALDSVVRPVDLVSSEYLQTLLVAVPLSQEKEFLGKYEQAAPMVVPRSARKISADSSYVLYGVTVFRKHAQDFEHAARELKWTPRDAPNHSSENTGKSNESPVERARKEEAELRKTERRQRNEVERLAAVAYSDIVKAWGHIKVIRVFVESVLRYGLPLAYVTASFQSKIPTDKAEARIIDEFSFLGGNSMLRDSKGRIKDEDFAEYAALSEQDYKPFVIYRANLP